MKWIHLTARTRGAVLLADHILAARFWRALRESFPGALSACLMPTHLHVINPVPIPEADARRCLTRVIAGAMRGRGKGLWDPVPPPAPIPDRFHLNRQIRYVVLNPCRDGLCADPLEWMWSTHRDVMGAVVDPWITAERLAAALGEKAGGFARRHHVYVSGDPSVDVRGTSPPQSAIESRFPEYGLSRIRQAVASALRTGMDGALLRPEGRTLFVHLCLRQGYDDAALLARFMGVTARSVDRYKLGRPPGLAAAALCLGDPRLQAGVPQKGGGRPPAAQGPVSKSDKRPGLNNQTAISVRL